MNAKRKIQVFSAGCPACEEVIALVKPKPLTIDAAFV
jgi:hypothetical protein